MKIADHAMPEIAMRRAAYASHAWSRRFRDVTDKGIDSISPPVTMRPVNAGGGPLCLVLFRDVTSPGSLRSADRRRSLAIRRGRARLRAAPRGGRWRSCRRRFWTSVREQFVMPPDLAVMNAANLCPASRPALEALTRETQSVDRDPSPNNRARLYPEKENTRKALAEFLRVTPDEIIITRNTSESNNLVSSGLDLKAGDEVHRPLGQSSKQPDRVAREGQAIRLHGRRGRTEKPASGHGVLRRRLHARDHAANEGAVLHASVEHGRRSDAG